MFFSRLGEACAHVGLGAATLSGAAGGRTLEIHLEIFVVHVSSMFLNMSSRN